MFAHQIHAVSRKYGRSVSKANLGQISAALQSYHKVNGCFPPAYIADKNGKPMHSWRTLILPYLNHNDIYRAYDFNEPWDGPNNKRLSAVQVPEFLCPGDQEAGEAKTTYVAVVAANTAWAGDKPRKSADLSPLSRTVMLVEIANSNISWAEPRDLSLDSLATAGGTTTLDVSSRHSRFVSYSFVRDRRAGASVLMADFTEDLIPNTALSVANLQKWLRIGGYDCKTIGAYPEDFEHGVSLRPNWRNIAALAVWLVSVGTLLTQAVRSRKRLSVPPSPS